MPESTYGYWSLHESTRWFEQADVLEYRPLLNEWVRYLPATRPYVALTVLKDGTVIGTTSQEMFVDDACEVRARRFEITPKEAIALCEEHGISPSPELRKLVSPVICSQAAVARFLGRSANTARLLETLKQEGVIERFAKGPKRTFKVWFADSQMHARASAEISKPGKGS